MRILKSFRFWLFSLFGLYTLAGFFLIPWLLVHKVPALLKEKASINIEISKASFNPFSYELALYGLKLKDQNMQEVLATEQIYLNYQPLALTMGSIVFEKLVIEKPTVYATITKNGELGLANIIPPATNTSATKESQTQATIVLQQLVISNGFAKFLDSRADTFTLDFGPYNFIAHDISTQKGAINAHKFTTILGKDAKIAWEGGMSINPLKLYGKINLENLDLASLYAYGVRDIEAKLNTAVLSLKLPYNIDLSGEPNIFIDNAQVRLDNVELIDNDHNKLLNIPNLQSHGISMLWPQKNLNIESLNIDGTSVFASLDKNGEINLLKAFEPKKTSEKTSKSSQTDQAWDFSLKDIAMRNTQINLDDQSTAKGAKTSLKHLSLHVTNVTSDKNIPINYALNTIINKDTNLSVKGDFLQETQSLSSQVLFSKLHVEDFTNYLDPYLNAKIRTSSISTKADIYANMNEPQQMQIQADAQISDFVLDAADGNSIIGWKNFEFKGINYTNNPALFEIQGLKLTKASIQAHIAKDGSTNFSNLIKESTKETAEDTPKKEEEKKLLVKIGPFELVDATSDFSDLSVPFPFKTKIHDLNGKISALDFSSSAPSKLALNGKIDKYGYADIKGELTPLDIKKNSQIDVLFKNISLNALSPYSGKFVGQKIDSGKLSMQLSYDIEKSKLKGSNKINIDSIKLGENIQSKHAVSLPLGLAIALLEDSSGQIDLDLPVSGDMDNPEFSYGSVVWKAIGNMITGIVSAPFRFLGSILGIDGEALKSIDFDAGSYAIISTELEKLANLEKILGKRPGIKVSIAGGYDVILDTKILQKEAFDKLVDKELAQIKDDANSTKVDQYAIVLEKLFTQDFGAKAYEELKKTFVVVEKEDTNSSKKQKNQLDLIGLNASMQDKITQKIEIAPESLQALANKRAQTLVQTLVSKYKIDAARIKIKDPLPQVAAQGRWVPTQIEIEI